MKRIIITALLGLSQLAWIKGANAQLKAGLQGVYIKPGTTFSVDGLFMVPEDATLISGNSITLRSLTVTGPRINGIQRLYELTKPIAFRGLMGMYFQPEELNGNNLSTLTLAFSKTPSTHYTDYLLPEGSAVDQKESMIENAVVDLPAVSNVTAVTPFILPGQYSEVKPNNFLTPNGDGLNDFWVVDGIENFPHNEVKIWDRSGRVVFSAQGYNNTWDGTLDSRALPEDSYYFVLYLDGGKAKLTGYISLVRKE